MLASELFDWLGKLDVDVITILCITGAAVAIFGFVARAWRRVCESENRAALVGMMIQRGMSVADIERVMQACVDPEDEEEEVKPDVRIITLMKENEYEGNDIERVLDAARISGEIDADVVKVIEALVEQGAEVGEIEGILDARRTPPATPKRIAV